MKIKENYVVLYKTQPALVTSIVGDKIEITTSNGSKKVREKDIDILHQGPVKNLSSLINADQPQANIEEAYEFFLGETPSFKELSELIWGDYKAEEVWGIWKEISTSFYFKCTSPTEPIHLRSKEEIQASQAKAQAKKDEGAERKAFHERLAACRKKDALPISNEDHKYLQDVEALALGKSEKSRTLKEAGITETPEAAHALLMQTGYWNIDFNPWPVRHGHSLTSALTNIPVPEDTKERLDLTHLDSWAIDNEWSADPDDAVSVDGETVWVHIADPASTVLPDSPADIEARARGATLYVPEGAARMLADSSIELFALGLTASSRALSFKLSFTETGAINEVSIHRTLVKVTRLSYAEALNKKNDKGLAKLFAIAERNIERRKAAGAVFIDLPEIHLTVTRDDNNYPTVKAELLHPQISADMVREMMLLAGEGAARFAFKHKIPFQYVSQESPDLPKEIPEGLAGEYRKRRAMKSRKVGTIPADHAGLGIGMYSQVTSPLRRYGDLVAHQQLHLFLDNKPLMDTEDMLMRIAAGDSAARECTLAERKTNMHWILYHLLQNPEWIGDAIVVEKNGAQATLLIPEFARETKTTLTQEYSLNDTIKVRAGNIHIPTQTISFIPL
ncbi:MAG TPA: RNB domain-containing ribonuclease [Treponemataceae bacterium]|nr:RNB domain-containing ribonuclease [Treponemataceae bacterium]